MNSAHSLWSSMSSTSPCTQPPLMSAARMWRSASKCMSCKQRETGVGSQHERCKHLMQYQQAHIDDDDGLQQGRGETCIGARLKRCARQQPACMQHDRAPCRAASLIQEISAGPELLNHSSPCASLKKITGLCSWLAVRCTGLLCHPGNLAGLCGLPTHREASR